MQRLPICVALLLGLAAVPGTPAATGGVPPYVYYYFKTPVGLNLDASKVAIYRNSAADSADADLATTASKYGLAPENLEAHTHYAWTLAGLNAAADNATIEHLVASMANDPDLEFVSPVLVDAEGDALLITSTLLVRFDTTVAATTAEALLQSYGAVTIEPEFAGLERVYRVELASRNGFEVLDLANSLALLPEVDFAEPDKVVTYHHHLLPNDTYFVNGGLWGLRNTGQSGGTPNMDIDADLAWDVTTGDPNIIVCIFDLGVQQNHPDLNQIPGADFTGEGGGGGPVNACDNHGTQVAGCATAIINNSRGVVGVAPNSRARSYRIGISNGCATTSFTGQDSWLAAAINEARTLGHRVTVSSFSRGLSSTVSTAYNTSRNAGLVHFGSSGNNGTASISYPSSLDSVYSVGAVNRNGNRSSFSNYGEGLAFVAPGQSIWTTDRTGTAGSSSGDYYQTQGTSFSAPYAAGVAALVLSIDSSLTAEQVGLIMAGSCKDRGAAGYDTVFGWGIVNANDALRRPQPFNLSQPAQGATAVSSGPTLSWTASTNAQKYEVIVDDDPTFATPNFQALVNAPSLSVALPAGTLVEGRTYYWRVEALRYDAWRQASNPVSRSFRVRIDCNGNGIDDALDIASGFSQDCNDNGRPDECDLNPVYLARSPEYTPLEFGEVHAFIMPIAPDAIGPVTLTFEATGDLGASAEFVSVDLNGTPIGLLWTAASTPECPTIVTDQLVLSAATYNAAKGFGPGPAVITMAPNSQVNPIGCPNPTYINVRVSYSGPVSFDLDGSGVPDECEGIVSPRGDANCDGLLNFDDINCFVSAIISQSQWRACVGADAICSYTAVNDINQDGLVNFADIAGFVDCLIAGACP